MELRFISKRYKYKLISFPINKLIFEFQLFFKSKSNFVVFIILNGIETFALT